MDRLGPPRFRCRRRLHCIAGRLRWHQFFADRSLTSKINYRTSNIREMRILMIAAEGPPLLHAGALIDVMDALPHELRSRGHEVAVALPHYRENPDNPAFHGEGPRAAVDARVGAR